MINTKGIKQLLLTIGVSSFAVVGAFLASGRTTILTKASNTEYWGHYSYVSPTLNNVGCREFYVSCTDHSVRFDEPSAGTILERGQPTTSQIQEWESLNDGRIIPQYKVTDTVYQCGIYPQTVVTDSSLLNELNSLTKTYENGYYFLNGTYYEKVIASPFTDYTFDNGDSIVSGDTYWFTCEPIKWKVIASEDGDHFLTTEKVIDKCIYNTVASKQDRTDYQGNVGINVYGVNYKYSLLRNFLNTTFYNKAFFIDNENILTTEVDNSSSTTIVDPNPYECENTYDKLFALSYQELMNESYFPNNNSRICKTTDYAKAIGAYTSTVSGFINNGWYYTRSPQGSSALIASYVYHAGIIYDGLNLSKENAGIRPAFHLSSN